jgi:hypothetical protein
MLTWQAVDGIGLEGVRIQHAHGGLRALGRLVRPGFTASYRLLVGEDGVVQRVSLTSATVTRERHLTLNRSEEGIWLADSGSGSTQPPFGAALDVDVAFSVLYNSLPIRRLRLHRQARDEAVPMVFVSLPELEPRLVTQHYHTVSTIGADGRAVVGFSWDDFSADLVVDGEGFVHDYPGIATLAEPAAPATAHSASA